MDLWFLFATIAAYPLEIPELERYLAYINYEPVDSLIVLFSLQLIKMFAIMIFGEILDIELERLAELEFQMALRRHYLDLRRLG